MKKVKCSGLVQPGLCIANTCLLMNFKRPQVLSIGHFLILPKAGTPESKNFV